MMTQVTLRASTAQSKQYAHRRFRHEQAFKFQVWTTRAYLNCHPEVPEHYSRLTSSGSLILLESQTLAIA